MQQALATISILILILFPEISFAQIVFEHQNSEGINQFCEELTGKETLELNSLIKPYSRLEISEVLQAAAQKQDFLNRRQKKELAYYLQVFGLESGEQIKTPLKSQFAQNRLLLNYRDLEIRYHDSTFRFSIRPIAGYTLESNGEEQIYRQIAGLSAMAYVGKHIGVYASLRDQFQSGFPRSSPAYFTQEAGGNYKINEGGRIGGEFSEMRGGITYSFKQGSIGMVKDHVVWGEGYHGSNIFSGRTPSFPMIVFKLKPAKWIELNYFHGWLVSEVIDSSRSYYTTNGDYRGLYVPKYIAANMLTIRPWRGINVSAGNSIVYSDMPVQLGYLIPVMFYKSLDHTINHGIDNQNSQMYASLSIRRINNLHFFLNYFIDDFSVTRIHNPDRHNFTSLKVGYASFNFLIPNILTGFEYTRTNPVTFKHRVPSTTFETNKYNLGHYLRDNSEEYHAWIRWKPFAFFDFKVSYTHAIHYNEYAYTDGHLAERYPPLSDKTWSHEAWQFILSYAWAYNSHLFISYDISNIRGYAADGKSAEDYLNLFSPAFLHGQRNIVSAGVNVGY